jgi:L-seryl-tRNA(Ser) seleniumtransferase
LPRSRIDSVAVEVESRKFAAPELAARLRRAQPPVIGLVAGGRLRLDLRTVFPEQEATLLGALQGAVDALLDGEDAGA